MGLLPWGASLPDGGDCGEGTPQAEGRLQAPRAAPPRVDAGERGCYCAGLHAGAPRTHLRLRFLSPGASAGHPQAYPRGTTEPTKMGLNTLQSVFVSCQSPVLYRKLKPLFS